MYQWGNGIRPEIRYQLFPSGNFLSLDQALDTYAYWQTCAQEWVTEWNEDPAEMWHPSWFPLMGADGKYFDVVHCPLTSQATAPVYHVTRDEYHEVFWVYDSVTAMLETVAACYAIGAYSFDAAGRRRVDPVREARIRREHNPQRTAWWLAQVPGVEAVEELVGRLQDPAWRDIARTALRELRDSCTVPPLIQLLQEAPLRGLRFIAVELLGTMQDPRALTLLLQALRDPDTLVRQEAIWYLGKLRDARALASLLQQASHDPDAEVRVRAILEPQDEEKTLR